MTVIEKTRSHEVDVNREETVEEAAALAPGILLRGAEVGMAVLTGLLVCPPLAILVVVVVVPLLAVAIHGRDGSGVADVRRAAPRARRVVTRGVRSRCAASHLGCRAARRGVRRRSTRTCTCSRRSSRAPCARDCSHATPPKERTSGSRSAVVRKGSPVRVRQRASSGPPVPGGFLASGR